MNCKRLLPVQVMFGAIYCTNCLFFSDTLNRSDYYKISLLAINEIKNDVNRSGAEALQYIMQGICVERDTKTT